MTLALQLTAAAVAIVALAALARWRGEVVRELRGIRRTLLRRQEPDAGCEPGLPHLEHVSDANSPYLVLFAWVLYSGREAIEDRAREWRQLFDHPGPVDDA